MRILSLDKHRLLCVVWCSKYIRYQRPVKERKHLNVACKRLARPNNVSCLMVKTITACMRLVWCLQIGCCQKEYVPSDVAAGLSATASSS